MKKRVLPIIIIASTIILWLVFYNKLPGEVPIHWNSSGEVDGYATKFNAMLMSLGTMVLIYLVLVFIPRIDPKKSNYKYFSKGYSIINLSTLLLFFVINILMLLAGLDYKVNVSIVMPILVGITFIVIGNYMPQMKPNYFVGIKTPWTLNDENNWKQTHRFGGKTFIIGGLLLILSIFLPARFVDISFLIILVILLSPIVYSFILFKKKSIE
ncbi:SdpI family protein [Bacillus sp. EB01]|uniref:SdpI family protein n=1 Tax=Bacillus sp. EB01 TaxID=1347086 RepID=UPI0005C66DEC|nr:SdpI family protein [Bacillus sp. EB01]